MEKFKPNKALELDVMKSLLSDISKLNYFIDKFDDGKVFWIVEINKDLYKILKYNYLELKDHAIFDVSLFYERTITEFKTEFPKYNLDIYEEFFALDFDFYSVVSNYKIHIVRKEIIHDLDNLKNTFETAVDLNPTLIMNELNQIRKRFESII